MNGNMPARSRGRRCVVHVLSSLDGGGTEHALVRWLRQADHQETQHIVVTLRAAGELAAQLPDDVRCIGLGIRGTSRTASVRLASVLRSCRANVVHVRNTRCWLDGFLAWMLVMLTGSFPRLLLGFHGLDEGTTLSTRARHVAWLATRCGAYVTSVSRHGNAMLQQAGVRQNRIVHLPNGVGVEAYRSVSDDDRMIARTALQVPEHAVVLMNVGSLTHVKGQDTLLHALAHLPVGIRQSCHVVLVGDGPNKPALQAQAAALGVAGQVMFAGHRADIARLLSAADVYIVPSRFEGVSNAMLEAMASGLPIITTRVGDHADVVRNDIDGVVVPCEDAPAMSVAIEPLLTDPALRQRMGDSARLRVGAFSMDAMVRAYQACYASCPTEAVVAKVAPAQ